MKKRGIKLYFNAPITLGFCGICLIAFLLSIITNGKSTYLLFSTYSSNILNPLTYIRLIGHVFGHASWSHLVSNMLYILLLGPILEEKYHQKLIMVIIVTALTTGLVHYIVDPDTMLLGASGVVFAFILLSSITGKSDGIPITLIIVAIMWLGNEILTGVSNADGISHLAHIVGGVSGALMGLFYKKK